MAGSFKHVVVDDFLSEALRHGLLEYTLRNRAAFQRSQMIAGDRLVYKPELRTSLRLAAGLGPFKNPFKQAVHARLDQVFSGLGITPFTVARSELELAAHQHGAVYRPHTDTVTGKHRHSVSDRIISLVYYFHAVPRRFVGGELALHPLGSGEPVLIEPRNNRLLAFPSMARHEVLHVHCRPNNFAHARFAINCWLHRAR